MIWLGGEGNNELGNAHAAAPYREPAIRGVLHALLDHAAPGASARVVGGTEWSKVPKYSAQPTMPPEARNLLGVVQKAKERRCSIVAFVRDSDEGAGRHAKAHLEAIADGARRAAELFPGVSLVGGLARPVLEAWILAFDGVPGTLSMTKAGAQRALATKGVEKDTAAMVAIVEARHPDQLPADATDVRQWIEDARAALQRPT